VRRVASIRGAVAWLDRVGLALLFPRGDLVLPSLWEAVAGESEMTWAVREDDGTFVSFTPEMDRVWSWKDELPAQRLACVGKHVRGRVALVSLDLLPALYALRDEEPREDLERDLLAVVEADGPCTVQDLRDALPQHDGKRVPAAAERLQRRLVLTSAGLERRDRGWSAVMVDLVARRYADRLRALPAEAEARRAIVARLLSAAGELSAVDVTAALGWRKAAAVEALESLDAERVDEDGIVIWKARR
jgi:hypothetical protein